MENKKNDSKYFLKKYEIDMHCNYLLTGQNQLKEGVLKRLEKQLVPNRPKK